MSFRSSAARRDSVSATGVASVAFLARAMTRNLPTGCDAETRRSGADGELRGRAVIVDAPTDLACEHHRSLGLAHAVTGETAGRRDERLRAQPRGIAAAPRELAPGVEQRLPERRDVLADRPVGRDRAPDHAAVCLQVARQRR